MYVDGFVVGVKTDKKAEYLVAAKAIAEVFLELGATRYVETWADEVKPGNVTSFPQAVKLAEDETVVFAWVEYPDKATRDLCMVKAFEDPRITTLDDVPINGQNMIMGGFDVISEMSR